MRSFLISTVISFTLAQSNMDGSPTMSSSIPEASMSPQSQCVLACPITDVGCKANCVGVPNPSDSDISNYNQCAAQCNNSTGDATETASCMDKCRPLFSPTAASSGPRASGHSKNGSMSWDNSSSDANAMVVTYFSSSLFILAAGFISFSSV